MAFQDEFFKTFKSEGNGEDFKIKIYEISNRAADNFLGLLCNDKGFVREKS